MRRKPTALLLLVAVAATALASFSFHVYHDLLWPDDDGGAVSSPPPPLIAALSSAILPQSFDSRRVHAVHEEAHLRLHGSTVGVESVLFPGWEVLVLVPPNTASSFSGYGGGGDKFYCRFHNGDKSVARPAGRAAFRCFLPTRVRRLRPFYTPEVISSAANPDTIQQERHDGPPAEIHRWTLLAYESVSTPDDVILFVKGVNKRQGMNTPLADLRCVFVSYPSLAVVATTAATSSAQEVFRCPHPPPSAVESSKGMGVALRVSLAVWSDPAATPIQTVANYLPAPSTAHDNAAAGRRGRSRVCACTMVFNVAKFLREWVTYHAAVGVERFFLYDNGSEDALESAVSRLGSEGYDVSTRFWPWPKTQEAGFSHCAVVNRDACEWMAFIDVDEFIFAPAWAESNRPNRSMLASLVKVDPTVGQVSIPCLEFGPSGQLAHPRGGVTQGYTCRKRKDERHKSLVRLDGVAESLVNSVHHFGLRDGLTTRWTRTREARVNHYKYQAWKEFKTKFRRRVSTYVADWTETTNPGSKDRAPGLGFEPIEPRGWTGMFCEVNDTMIRRATQRWFRRQKHKGNFKMAWEK